MSRWSHSAHATPPRALQTVPEEAVGWEGTRVEPEAVVERTVAELVGVTEVERVVAVKGEVVTEGGVVDQ
eukprot:5540418-Prymnesium_polylepis.1